MRQVVRLPSSETAQDGVPNATLFTGTFSAPVTWTVVTLANGTHNYMLAGTLSGTMGSSLQTVEVAVQSTVNTRERVL